MKYIYLFLIVTSSQFLNSQCATTVSINITTPPSCSTCCDGIASVSHSCAITYTWMCACGGGGNVGYNLCAGATYSIAVGMASTLCCGATVGTATVYIPKPGGTSITEINEIKNLIVSPNPSNGGLFISTNNSKEYSTQIIIQDINGKTVYDNFLIINKNSSSIPLDAKAGIYFATIVDRETLQRVVKKIVIEK